MQQMHLNEIRYNNKSIPAVSDKNNNNKNNVIIITRKSY